MVVQQGAVFWKKQDTTLLFTSLAFAVWFLGTALDILEVDNDLIALILGVSTVGLCNGLQHTVHRGLTPFWYFVGSIAFFGGLFSLMQDTPVELLFLAVACSSVYLSIYVRSRTLLFVSIASILGYIGYFTSKHFLDSFGWPLVLILLGLILIGLSTFALRISRRYMDRP
jgi:hypothetical protein